MTEEKKDAIFDDFIIKMNKLDKKVLGNLYKVFFKNDISPMNDTKAKTFVNFLITEYFKANDIFVNNLFSDIITEMWTEEDTNWLNDLL